MTSNIGAHLGLVAKMATPSSRHGLDRSAGKHHIALSIAFQSANKGHFNLSFASETANSRLPRPRQLRATLSRNVLGGLVLYNEATRAVGPRKAVDGGGDCETSRVTAGSTRQGKGATPPFEVSRSAVRPRPGSAPRPAEVPPAQTPAIPTTFFRGARRRRRGSGSPTKTSSLVLWSDSSAILWEQEVQEPDRAVQPLANQHHRTVPTFATCMTETAMPSP